MTWGDLILIGVPLICFVGMLGLIYREALRDDRELLELSLTEEHELRLASGRLAGDAGRRAGRGTKPYDWAA